MRLRGLLPVEQTSARQCAGIGRELRPQHYHHAPRHARRVTDIPEICYRVRLVVIRFFCGLEVSGPGVNVGAF
jgi:hypothetical protein